MPHAALRHTNVHATKPFIKKRHWCIGSLVILIGSWITHSTTATVYDDYNNQQAIAFAQALPNKGHVLNGGLPDALFAVDFKIVRGPISDGTTIALSPTQYLLEPITRSPSATASLKETIYTIVRGDTLGGIFKKLDLNLALPYLISQHETGKQLVSLSVGKDMVFKTNQQQQLKQIDYPMGTLQELVVNLEDSAVVDAQIENLPYKTKQRSISGEITSSLYDAAIEAGLSNALVMEMVRIFGWDIDFMLDIHAGDHFHVIYQEHHLENKKIVDGDIVAAEFTTQNKRYRAMRFEDSEGSANYYTPQGESMLGTFLRSPVEFSRISSRFGKRKHPILKTWRAHKGVDYAASRGTPIRATADGKVIHAGRKGGYGKTVVLRHAGRFSTLYGHMNGYAKGVRTGKRIKQGDVLGYIGSTGLATGPHLHYEFRLDGVHRNPLTFRTPKASSVSAEHRSEFESITRQWMAQLNSMAAAYQLAQNSKLSSNNQTQALLR